MQCEYGVDLDAAFNRTREDFLVYLTVGDYSRCLDITLGFVDSKENFMKFCLQIVQPCMYELGKLCEEGEISIAQVQLAVDMIDRFIAYLNSHLFISGNSQISAMVLTVPTESHELGSRIVADFLELHGCRVLYPGNQLSADNLLTKIQQNMPDIILISITMPDNVRYAKELISCLRNCQEIRNIKIVVGGQAFSSDAGLWKRIGADGMARDAQDAVKLTNELLQY